MKRRAKKPPARSRRNTPRPRKAPAIASSALQQRNTELEDRERRLREREADWARNHTINQREALGKPSANSEDRKSGNMPVVSVRLRSKVLDEIDELVSDSIGTWPRVTRAQVIQDAVDGYLADRRRDRESEQQPRRRAS